MTTRNFRVHNGISVGDIVISASANTITGGATAAPSADGDFSNKKYVDDQDALIASDTLTFTNKTFDANGTGNSITNIDSGNFLSGFFLDEDNMSSNDATAVASQQSIKAYVDTEIGNISSTTLTAGNTTAVVSDTGSDGAFTVTCDGNTELVVNDTSSTFSGDVTVTGNLTVSGSATYLDVNNLAIEDNLLIVSKNNSGGSDLDAGLMVERGSAGNNAAFYWNEGDDKFKAVLTTSGSDATAITDSSTATIVANLEGTASAAQYSDVAERFASDTVYEPGTVVALGGAEEITAVNEEASDEVFGVISSLNQAAFKMNNGAGTDETHPLIAMTGRVNVKVIGTVNKGDRLISASVPGYARAATKAECTAFNVLGRALTNKTESGQGSVLAAVRVSH
tara:strand:+ start:1408 stop:2595 length:1188 start_codon:yes stop_codon:yes gene_type:complete